MPCPRTTILSRSVSSETRQGQADFSRRREPIAFRRWSARAQSFLYIYQEGPVGARGKREAFSKRLWKTPLHVCTCSQPFPKRLSRPEGFEPPSHWLRARHSAVELRAYNICVLLELVAPGRFELPLDGILVRCLCQLGYGATYYLERPAGIEPLALRATPAFETGCRPFIEPS